MSERQACPRCGGVLRGGALAGSCARCLILGALEGDAVDEDPRAGAPLRFAGYEIVRKLGEGGMGVVHEARQVGGIERVVALKRIRDGELADTAARRRFLAEARAAAELRHPHLVPIYDVGERDGELYFTMQLLPGGTLAEHAGRFAENGRAAALVEKLARAVHAAHEKRILHRDLKPQNVLFDDRGEPHVADFGIAKRLDDKAQTRTGTMAGTAHYMAPEQATGHAKRDSVAADVWSLGVILYELLAGRRPFTGPTPHEILRAVVEEEPERLAARVDRDLATICATCLQKEPERRYISAEALADDLDRYLRGAPVSARRPGRLERAARFCRRHPALSALLAAAAVALVTLTSWALVSAREQARARRDEVLVANAFAARAVAGTVLAKLREYGDVIAEEASDPRLAAALARDDQQGLRAYCETVRARHAAGNPALDIYFVVDAAGRARVLVPAAGVPGRTYSTNLSLRDYFHGARAFPAGASRPVYVSRAFRSTNDDQYKVAMASPIRGADGAFAGLLAATILTDRHLGNLALSDDRRTAVLVVRRDRDDATAPLPSDHILLVHDGVAQGAAIPVESDALLRLSARRDAARVPLEDRLKLPPPSLVEMQDDYRDPTEKPDSDGPKGPWLVGIAPVGSTELSVFVQTRLDTAMELDQRPFRVLLAWSIGGAVLLGAGFFGAMRGRRGARRRPS